MQYYAALHRKKEKIWWFTSGFSILGASTHWDRAIGLPLEDGHFDTNALVGTSSRATYPRMIELVRWCQVWMSIHGYGRTSAWTLHIIRLIDHDIVESTKILPTKYIFNSHPVKLAFGGKQTEENHPHSACEQAPILYRSMFISMSMCIYIYIHMWYVCVYICVYIYILLLLIYYRLIYHVHYYLTTNVVIVHIYIYTLYINTYVYMYNHTIYHTI